MITVIDSGVWISGLHFGGTPWEAIQKAVAIARIAVCDQVREEISQALTHKMAWRSERLNQTLAFYFDNALWVPISGRIRGVCRDPDDDAIIECAVNAKAELIISGDKDLLTLKQYDHIRIITPRQYLAAPDNGNDLRSR